MDHGFIFFLGGVWCIRNRKIWWFFTEFNYSSDKSTILLFLLQNGRIYIIDYKDLEGIKRNGEDGNCELCYAAEPLCLFYVKNSGDLIPIAIQLFQHPGETNPIWTPEDAKYDWLLAKMWFRNADHQMHQVCVKPCLHHGLRPSLIFKISFAMHGRNEAGRFLALLYIIYKHVTSQATSHRIFFWQSLKRLVIVIWSLEINFVWWIPADTTLLS